MRSDESRRLARCGLARRLMLAIVVCCAGTLASIPAAGARREHERASASVPASGAPASPSAAGEQEAPSPPAGEAPPAPSATPTQQDPGDPRGGGADEAPGGRRAKHGARSQHDHAATQPSEQEDAQAGAPEQPEASAGGEGGGAQEQASPQLAADKSGRGKHKEGSGSREGGKHEGERKGKGKGKAKTGETESSTGASSGETPSGTAPKEGAAPKEDLAHAQLSPTLAPQLPASSPVAAAASSPAPAAAASATSGQLALGTAVSRRHRAGVPSRPLAHARARPLDADAPAHTAAPPVHAGNAQGDRAANAPRAPRTNARRRTAPGRPSPIVKTITRIVDVVPLAVRMMIAGLLALALALALRSRVAAVRARRLDRQRAELLEDVGLLQAALLPSVPTRLGPVGTSVAYRPAAGPGAGGDFYDVFALEDGQLAVIVGDVSGHGRHALPHTALVRFTLRAYLEAGLSPRDALQTAGAVLERQLGDAFATVVLATYQPRERVLVYACAGHPAPIVLGAQPGARPLPALTICTAPPIGVGMRTGTRQTAVSIPGRAQVCLHTDGVTEARVGSELFGGARLADMLAELGPDASAATLLERVAERADARPDDMAACMLAIEGEDDAPTVLVEELELDREDAASVRTERFLRACGVGREEVADIVHSALVAAGRARTVVLEVRRGEGPAEVALRREHLSYLHAPRENVEAAR